MESPIIIKSTSLDGVVRESKVYIGEDLKKKLKKNHQNTKKFLKAIRTFGYVGQSVGKKNGIVKLKAKDTNFAKGVNSFINSQYGIQQIRQYGLRQPFEGVKIVAHCMNGERIIGVKDSQEYILLFGIKNYKK